VGGWGVGCNVISVSKGGGGGGWVCGGGSGWGGLWRGGGGPMGGWPMGGGRGDHSTLGKRFEKMSVRLADTLRSILQNAVPIGHPSACKRVPLLESISSSPVCVRNLDKPAPRTTIHLTRHLPGCVLQGSGAARIKGSG